MICGQVRFASFPDGLRGADREEFERAAEDLVARDRLIDIFDCARSMMTVQLINYHIWADESYEETLEPLGDWLLEKRLGVLVTDDRTFYDRSGKIE